MADVWVSTGKRYCEICKVWFGNNKASQDHHDRGERHKAMLANKIRETMQKGKKQELANAKLNATLAKMTAAATSTMAKRGEGIIQGPQLPSMGLQMNIFDPNKFKDVGSMAKEMSARRDGIRKGISGAAPPPAANHPMKITKDDVVSAYRDLTNPQAAGAQGPALPEAYAVKYLPETQTKCAEICWVRAKSEEGTYYWNLFDNSTRWDQPSHFYTEEQYEEKVREFEENRKRNYYGLDEVKAVKMGKQDVEAYIKSQIAQSGLANLVETNRKELNIVDRSEKGRKAEKRRRWEERQKEQQRLAEEEQQTRMAAEEATVNLDYDGIPLPEEEPTSSSQPQPEIIMPPPPPAPVYEVKQAKEPEKKDEPKFLPPAIGGWIRIKPEEKPDIPYESPLTKRFREEEEQEKIAAEIREKEEPKIEFEEKTAAVMTKKIKGPIEFKKKTGPKNIRKRGEAD
ncbi:unnamed protein product [Caenorhabditis bovis]|uniref:Matrin-type domain-containing protein n=1 Tax=Caenorhabditis bovis TaxID=2654633 RepID=A0A8S1F4S9_9PELO|nr:unnamed protein product [Caenorhabditis bovis]